MIGDAVSERGRSTAHHSSSREATNGIAFVRPRYSALFILTQRQSQSMLLLRNAKLVPAIARSYGPSQPRIGRLV